MSIPAPEEEAEEEPETTAQEAAPAAPAEDSPAYQAYDRSAVPDLINGAVDLAFTQWEEDAAKGTKKFSRLGKYNKYSYWQCGSGSGCDIGWCGAFLGYVYDNAGVPMDKPADSVPVKDLSLPTLDEVENWMRARRSVRRFASEDVDRATKAICPAPSGATAICLTAMKSLKTFSPARRNTSGRTPGSTPTSTSKTGTSPPSARPGCPKNSDRSAAL